MILLIPPNSRVYYRREGSVEPGSVELRSVGMVDPLTCGVLPTIPLSPFPIHPPRPPPSPHPFPRSVIIIQYENTALHRAVMYGHSLTVTELIKAGADLEAKDGVRGKEGGG